MSHSAVNMSRTSGRVAPMLAELRASQPIWFYTTATFLLLTIGFSLAPFFDDRTLQGVSVWAKPLKFSLSFLVMFGTLVLMARLVSTSFWKTRSGQLLVGILMFMVVGEMAYITYQAALGEMSHFNDSTAFHRIMYSLMGIGATTIMAMLGWFAWVVARQTNPSLFSQPLALSVVVGLALTVILGGGSGSYLGGQTSHFVGAAVSDANGLWLLNWSTVVGDLRVPHFFGMHAMQALPLVALLLPTTWTIKTRVSLVIGFAGVYSLFTLFTFAQALSGYPLIRWPAY